MQRKKLIMFSYLNFGSGFIFTNAGFARVISPDQPFSITGIFFIILGLLLIFLSGRSDRLFALARTRSRKIAPGRKRLTVTGLFMLFLLAPISAESSPLDWGLRNVEVGSSRLSDSDPAVLQTNFALLKFHRDDSELFKLKIRQTRITDLFGDQNIYRFTVISSPAKWLGFTAGYEQMPVGTLQLAAGLGPLHLAIGGGREALTTRSNAIADKIDLRSGYFDVSLPLPGQLSLSASLGAGKFGDGNKLRNLNTSISIYRKFSKFSTNYSLGYSQRFLDDFSIYYWSPNVYRELSFSPEIGFETDGFWLYLDLAVNRILEERYAGDAVGLRSWGANGELSMGYRMGPGYLYLTGRFWDSGVQRPGSGYRGRTLQFSYELSLND